MIIWLIGISGSGKTTLGNRLKTYLNSSSKHSFVIDGDFVRDFFDNDLGYSVDERKANIKRIILAAYVLSQNDIITIVCNIHPFEELRQFARRKIKGYNEIYLKRNISQTQKEDAKKMYQQNLGKTEIVGIDFDFEEPQHPDLVIDTGAMTEEESFAKLFGYLKAKYPEVF